MLSIDIGINSHRLFLICALMSKWQPCEHDAPCHCHMTCIILLSYQFKSRAYYVNRLQQKVKKSMYAPVLVSIWIVIHAFLTLTACLFTDIVNGVCMPHGVYSSVAIEKTSSAAIFFVAYLLPLSLMIFCYSRIVYTLLSR